MNEDIAFLAWWLIDYEITNHCHITIPEKPKIGKHGLGLLNLDVEKSGKHYRGQVILNGLESLEFRVVAIILPEIP